MSLSEMFENLGAPLKNPRWSWGSVRDSDGTVFLRVWQDGTKKINGTRHIWISDEAPADDNLGARERRSHTELVRSGHACYLVMCEAVDTKVEPRAVKSFDRREVFSVGEVILSEGEYWIELKERVDARSVAA